MSADDARPELDEQPGADGAPLDEDYDYEPDQDEDDDPDDQSAADEIRQLRGR